MQVMPQGWFDQFHHGGILSSTQVTCRLVQHQVIGWLRALDDLLINADFPESADIAGTFSTNLAINTNATCGKQNIGLAVADAVLVAGDA